MLSQAQQRRKIAAEQARAVSAERQKLRAVSRDTNSAIASLWTAFVTLVAALQQADTVKSALADRLLVVADATLGAVLRTCDYTANNSDRHASQVSGFSLHAD